MKWMSPAVYQFSTIGHPDCRHPHLTWHVWTSEETLLPMIEVFCPGCRYLEVGVLAIDERLARAA